MCSRRLHVQTCTPKKCQSWGEIWESCLQTPPMSKALQLDLHRVRRGQAQGQALDSIYITGGLAGDEVEVLARQLGKTTEQQEKQPKPGQRKASPKSQGNPKQSGLMEAREKKAERRAVSDKAWIKGEKDKAQKVELFLSPHLYHIH